MNKTKTKTKSLNYKEKKMKQNGKLIMIGIFIFMGLSLIFNPDFPNQIAPYRQLIGGIALYRALLLYKDWLLS